MIITQVKAPQFVTKAILYLSSGVSDIHNIHLKRNKHHALQLYLKIHFWKVKGMDLFS